MSKANGLTYSIPFASLHSNTSSETASTSQSAWFDHAFDFQNNYYYVRVDLDRVAGSAESAIFHGVAIECR